MMYSSTVVHSFCCCNQADAPTANNKAMLIRKIGQPEPMIAACMQYPVVPRNEYSRPTAVMLSHVYGAKDIVTAIKAAQVIISQYGVSGKSSCHHTCLLFVAHAC